MNKVIEIKLELWQVDVLRGVLGELLDGDSFSGLARDVIESVYSELVEVI